MIGHYLTFNGCCAQALATYEKAFGAKIIETQKYKDLPPGSNFSATKTDDLVLHARITINGSEVICVDSSESVQSGSNTFLNITSTDIDMIQKAWDILARGGEIFTELEPSFFAQLDGSLKDKFGINWIFSVPR